MTQRREDRDVLPRVETYLRTGCRIGLRERSRIQISRSGFSAFQQRLVENSEIITGRRPSNSYIREHEAIHLPDRQVRLQLLQIPIFQETPRPPADQGARGRKHQTERFEDAIQAGPADRQDRHATGRDKEGAVQRIRETFQKDLHHGPEADLQTHRTPHLSINRRLNPTPWPRNY